LIVAKKSYYNPTLDRMKLINETVAAVDQKLWSNKDGCYIDLQQNRSIGPYRTLTQEVIYI
jgi:hypothetical protein